VFTEGLRRTGRELTRERFIAAMEGMSNVDLGDFIIRFGPNDHNGSKFVDLTIIGRDGKFVN
jgi:ABC-type branched-subunit amino acid transport system substrate-binding protein